MTEDVQRRLSAILAADVVGYSRLMGADETGTLAALTALLDDIVKPLLHAHKGRLVKLMGDGALAEFSSVVDAINCAVAIQAAAENQAETVDQDRRIQLRIGINIGDIIFDGDDIFGDGVNIAARLEGLADPGGICVSRTVVTHVGDRTSIAFEDLGEVEVKNIAARIHAYRVVEKGATPAPKPPQPRPPRRFAAPLAALAALTALVVGLGWWWTSRPDIVPADLNKFAYELPTKPSIAVLALDNLSGDPAKDYIGEGLSENIISSLATSAKMFVIARNSSFHYQGTATPVQTIAEDLGVRYVLEGSVQQSGDTIRVTTQLIDALSGHHLWTKIYDRTLTDSDLFIIQDELTRDIAISLAGELITGSDARAVGVDDLDLHTLKLVNHGIAEFQKFTPEGNLRSEELLLEADKRSPDSTVVLVNLGWAEFWKLFLGQTDDPMATYGKARAYADRVLALNPRYPYGHALKGYIHLFALDHAAALESAERAVEYSNERGIATSVAGWVAVQSGDPQRGIQWLRAGMRTEPYHPDWIPSALSHGLTMMGQYEEANQIDLELAANSQTGVRHWAEQRLIATAVWEGDLELARKRAQDRLDHYPNESLARIRQFYFALKDTDFNNRFLDALRTAGIPEEPPG